MTGGPRLLALAPLRVEAAAIRRGAPAAQVRITGMGPDRSDAAARRLVAQEGADGAAPAGAVAVMGFGGALQTGLAPGDLVVATELLAARSKTRPDTPVVALLSAQLVADALRRAGLTVHTGPIVSVDHVVSGEGRAALGREHGALVVDMESAWLAPAAGGRPLAVVRAVVDTPESGLVSPNTLVGGAKAYRSLRRAASVLEDWAAATVAPESTRTVLLAGPRSFCAGVERAIQIVERALERFGSPVYVRKQIVHNIHVVRDLEARGAIFVDQLDEVPAESTVVFSAHGVSPRVRREAESRRLHAVDATCPLVAKVHAETRRFSRKGYRILLVGHQGHEEVEGTMGEAPEVVQLVEELADVDKVRVEDPTRVAYLTQTTLATDEVADVIQGLRARFPALVGPAADDICYATQNRQEAVRALAPDCQLLIVVGSPNSSNSNRLVEVAHRLGCPAHLIDEPSDLDLAWLAGVATVGVTAGASAPESLVHQVVSALATLGPVTVLERPGTTESVQFPLPTEVR